MSAAQCSRCPRIEQLRRGLCKLCYYHERNRGILYGRWEPGFVDAEPVRAHVRALQGAGVSLRRIPQLAGVPRSSLGTLLYGKPGRPPATFISRSVADRIRAVAIPADPYSVAADHMPVPSLGAQRRLRALVAAGWPMAHLAAELGMDDGNFGTMLHHRDQITAARHRAVVALFNRLQMTPGPSDRARSYGRSRRWPLPMQWDEDALDDPNAPTPASTLRREPYRSRAAS
jgi:hypothetical protein